LRNVVISLAESGADPRRDLVHFEFEKRTLEHNSLALKNFLELCNLNKSFHFVLGCSNTKKLFDLDFDVGHVTRRNHLCYMAVYLLETVVVQKLD